MPWVVYTMNETYPLNESEDDEDEREKGEGEGRVERLSWSKRRAG